MGEVPAMKEKLCDYCDQAFTPREGKQRFCNRECSIRWWQDERARAMALLRQQRECEQATHMMEHSQ